MAQELERETRRTRIDPRLKAAGWHVAPFASGRDRNSFDEAAALTEFPTQNGPADYALWDRSEALGVVEAKKITLGPQGVLTQAQRYSQGFTANPVDYGSGFRVPFLYSTNGEIIWFQDIRDPLSRSRKISAFHTPNALREFQDRDSAAELKALEAIPANPFLRPYQHDANQAIEQAIRDRKRKLLIAMATGTGKTLTLVNEVYRLMKAGVARRVLFLVDRRALAAQAVRAFASFEAEPGLKFDRLYELYSQRFFRDDLDEDRSFDPTVIPEGHLTDPQLGQSFVYVSTIQRMTINLFGKDAFFSTTDEPIDEDAGELDIPIHAFDLIIADECHRGYSAKEISLWRRTLDHFDAIKVGLTATPAAHTVAYFDEIAYKYDYERAVEEGYLVDYDAVSIKSNVRMKGLFLQEGEQVASVDTTTGQQQFDLLEDERTFDTTQIEQDITVPDSNRKILKEIKRHAEDHEKEHGRFPKTLIFAQNDLPHTSHADQLVDIARDLFGQGDAFVAKITGKVDRPLKRIREFRNRPKPAIAITVDLLTTGIDVPDLEFLVFLRPVRSRIMFEQMLGRGTRKGEKFSDKGYFVVFDCFDGTLLEYFRDTTGMTVEPPEADGKSISQIIEGIWENRDRGYNTRCLVKRLRRIEKQMSGDAREVFARFIPDGDIGAFAGALPSALNARFTETLSLLRDKDFQDLLLNYPRPPKSFLIAVESQDEVTSEWLIKGATGKEYKPEDYLKAFETFVLEHAEQVNAISILLSRPNGWGAQALTELRTSLAQAPEHFTEANLQKAFEVAHHKSLVDIISMVKRAAAEGSPLLTAEERVNQALGRATANLELTVEQAKWIEYIRQHLIANLSIDKLDFDDIPVLANRGGWGPANSAFGGHLVELITQLNTELAA